MHFLAFIVKGKAVPLQAWSGSEGSRKLRFPDFMTTAQDGGKFVSLTHRRAVTVWHINLEYVCKCWVFETYWLICCPTYNNVKNTGIFPQTVYMCFTQFPSQSAINSLSIVTRVVTVMETACDPREGHVIEQNVMFSGRTLAHAVTCLCVTTETRGQTIANHVGCVMKWHWYRVYLRVIHVFSVIIIPLMFRIYLYF
jgi:hypothetical protein